MVLNLFHKITMLVILCLNSNLESSRHPQDKPIPVHVKDWSKKTMTVSEDFWSNKKDIIVKQIGYEEYEKMLKNYDWKSIPEQMSIFSNGKMKEREAVYKKLGLLKVYQIATFNHFYNNKNYGEYAILRCPYNENSGWDVKAKWDTIYFIVERNAVEIIK